MHYESEVEEEEEKEDWRVQNVGTRRYQHQPPKTCFPFESYLVLVDKVTLMCI